MKTKPKTTRKEWLTPWHTINSNWGDPQTDEAKEVRCFCDYIGRLHRNGYPVPDWIRRFDLRRGLHPVLSVLSSLALVAVASAASITWDPNTEPDLAGYRIYWGPASRSYTNLLTVPAAPGVRITNWVPVVTVGFVAVTAFSTNGLESDYSNEITVTNRPAAPKNARQVSKLDGWLLRTNKSNPPTVTPVALVQTIPGTVISGTVSGPWGTLNRTATANTNGVAELVGKAIALSPSSLVSMTATKAAVPIALADERRVP